MNTLTKIARGVIITLTVANIIAIPAAIGYYVNEEIGKGAFVFTEFFGHFTQQAGLAFAAVMLVWVLCLKMTKMPAWIDLLRFCVSIYAIMIFPIFWFIVESFAVFRWDDGWNSIHILAPIVAVLTWYAFPPTTFRWYWPFIATIFPFLFTVVSLIRGAIDGWYPYDFLNVQTSSWAAVGAYIGGIFVAVLALGYLIGYTSIALKKRLS